jgi:hypothetical protein
MPDDGDGIFGLGGTPTRRAAGRGGGRRRGVRVRAGTLDEEGSDAV